MPNLYFCQPHARNQGMLRAVLSIHECERVITPAWRAGYYRLDSDLTKINEAILALPR